MLADFVATNRLAIIARSQEMVASRTAPRPSEQELADGIPVFLDQLGSALRKARSSELVDHSELEASAARHGHELLRMGLTIAQVVHDYGAVCQAITELAIRQDASIPTDDFRTLNLCLDDAIAGAVTEYTRQREKSLSADGLERLGQMAHELRNLLNSAVLAFESIKRGYVAAGGSTGVLLGRSLTGIRDLIDRSLAEVRLDAGIARRDSISVAELLEEVEVGAALQAQARALHFHVTCVERTLTIQGDRSILAAALANLLQNAFKFSRSEGRVALVVSATADRVMFEIEDECGGLPPGKSEELFRPFEQRGKDRSGMGLGLSICMKAARANGGELRVRDVPGVGCVFTLDLPRSPPPPLLAIDGGKTASTSPGGALASASAPPKLPKARGRA